MPRRSRPHPRSSALVAAAVLGLLASACDPGVSPEVRRSPTPSVPPSPTASPSVTPGPTETPNASPTPTATPAPPPDLGPGAPLVYRRRVGAAEIPSRALVPEDARPGETHLLPAAGTEPERLVVTWSRGDDPFAREQGLSIWEPQTGRPPWRAVAGTYAPARRGVLGIRLQSGDLTGDAYEDLLAFDETGGSGACGVWRVFASVDGSVGELLRRRTCDTDILLARGGLQVTAAVFEPGDAHCCPSALRRLTLRWDGSRWRREDVELIPLG